MSRSARQEELPSCLLLLGKRKVLIGAQTFSVDEASTSGAAVGTVSASNPSHRPLTYSITGGTGSALFVINSSTGAITVAPAATFNYDSTNQYTLIVQASDGILSSSATMTINVYDVIYGWRASDLVFTPYAGVGTFAFTRPLNTATVTNSSGNVVGINTNLGRFDYDPDTLALNGLRIEQSVTNAALHTRQLRVTHQLIVTGVVGTFQVNETVTATGGGTGTVQLVSGTTIALYAGSGTFSGILTGSTSLATATISSAVQVWVPTNITVAQSTGADGVALSGTRLTAAAGNATILQSLTLASGVRSMSALIKRVSGSGDIQLTTDNGTTWATVVSTSVFHQLSIPSQVLANPTFGIRLVANGDSIDIDYVQNENFAEATTPIPVTTNATNRGTEKDVLTLSDVPGIDLTKGGIYVDFLTAPHQSTTQMAAFTTQSPTSGIESQGLGRYLKTGQGTTFYQPIHAGSSPVLGDETTGNAPNNTRIKIIGTFRSGDYGANATGTVDETNSLSGVPTSQAKLYLGTADTIGFANNGWIKEVRIYRGILDAEARARIIA